MVKFRKIGTIFLPITLIILLLSYSSYQTSLVVDKADIYRTEQASLHLGAISIHDSIDSLFADLDYLSTENILINWIEGDQTSRQRLIENWITFSRTQKIYDQIRFLDNSGLERVRVNYNGGTPFAVADEKLQNKSNRYYFTDAIKLDQGQIFISPLDLNIENGAIEQPLKPMIRVAVPIFDKTGEKQGVVLLNYLAEQLLDQYLNNSIGSDNSHWLVNSEGYWLSGPTELEWGFMYNNVEASIAKQYPEAWKKISLEQAGQFENVSGGWSFESISPLLNERHGAEGVAGYHWKAVAFLPRDRYGASLQETQNYYLSITALVLLVTFISLSLLLALRAKQLEHENEIIQLNVSLEKKVKERTQQLTELKEQAENLAKTDPLTRIRNRLEMEHDIEAVIQNFQLHQIHFAVLMFDIDWFKRVNDTYGHAVGDRVLQQTAQFMKEAIRREDLVYRAGGEEFVVLLNRISLDGAWVVAQNIRTGIEKHFFEAENDRFKVTISGGIYHSSISSADNVHDVLKSADSAMYQAKNRGRNRVVEAEQEGIQ